MTIRDVTAADHGLYRELSQGFYSGEATLHPANFDHIDRTFEECVKGSPYARAVILEEEGRPAGFALFSFTWSNESGGFVVWLEELYVLPAFRGRKLGSEFMEWMLDEYKDATRIRLEITAGNDGARRLYARYGFEPLDYEQMVLDRK